MKRLAVVVLAMLLPVIIGCAKDYEVKRGVGEYEVKATIDKNPPVVGDNNIRIEIKDADGKHVTDATVLVEYSMPPMPGMPPMNYKADAELRGNEYRAKMHLSMAGPWNIDIKITRADRTSTMKFNVDAR